jgi:perosamine synthetase
MILLSDGLHSPAPAGIRTRRDSPWRGGIERRRNGTLLSDVTRIPLSVPDLSGNEEAYASEAIRSSWISSSGAFVQRFEREFASFCESGTALSVTNGTDALHLALIALGVGPGDEVLLPSLTYVATANAVRYVGAEPVFVDVEPGTWCLDPLDIERRITERSRAIIAVHLYGHPADMDEINAVAGRHGLSVIEDAAEAHGATYKGRICGSLGDCATFSFYGNKILTCGEGGALTTSNPELVQRARLFRGQGMDPERRYFFPVIGHNFRLTNVACAILQPRARGPAGLLGHPRAERPRRSEIEDPR